MQLFKSALPILRNLGREMAMQEGGGMLAHGQDLKNLSPMIKVSLVHSGQRLSTV